jgi:hypothetical protein
VSNQGNVEVFTSYDTGFGVVKPYRFTTGRWSGPQTPRIVQRLIADLHDPEARHAEKGFLADLCKDDSIYCPIQEFGNTDTPTVVVDFRHKLVSWRDEYDLTSVGWTFEEYLKLDFDNLTAVDASNPKYMPFLERFE